MLKRAHEDEDIFSIEVFQLENLINNNISFAFFNLSPHFSHGEPEDFIASVLKLSLPCTKSDIKKQLRQTDKLKPIVLICEKGLLSRDLVRYLQKKGFINAFFIKGGIMSLTERK